MLAVLVILALLGIMSSIQSADRKRRLIDMEREVELLRKKRNETVKTYNVDNNIAFTSMELEYKNLPETCYDFDVFGYTVYRMSGIVRKDACSDLDDEIWFQIVFENMDIEKNDRSYLVKQVDAPMFLSDLYSVSRLCSDIERGEKSGLVFYKQHWWNPEKIIQENNDYFWRRYC